MMIMDYGSILRIHMILAKIIYVTINLLGPPHKVMSPCFCIIYQQIPQIRRKSGHSGTLHARSPTGTAQDSLCVGRYLQNRAASFITYLIWCQNANLSLDVGLVFREWARMSEAR